MTPQQFYFRVYFGEFSKQQFQPNYLEMVEAVPEWYPWHGNMKLGIGMQNGFIAVFIDLKDRIVGARRNQMGRCSWVGLKPRQGDQVKLAMLLPKDP